jgi:phage shock protein PspC (stress-responsive transcriptional regulator)
MKPDYGLDAPGLVRTFFIVAVVAGLLAAFTLIAAAAW